MELFFSVGEPSGDLHGANLIRHLRRLHPGIRCVGYGGPRMAAAGLELHADLTALAVMWFLRVLWNIHRFGQLLVQADRCFRHRRPDAVVLIDYPGFNWWIARRAKAHGIPVFYYGTPQMWAWAGWRVRKMRRLVDHVLCKLPFEPAWFRARGCHATYVGHPYFDETTTRRLDDPFLRDQAARPGVLVTILPGSRGQEVTQNLPAFLRAAERVRQSVPEARFAVASFNADQAACARRLVAAARLPVEVYVGRTPELIEAARCCLACSGSVSLELLHHTRPAVVVYTISRAALVVQRFFRKARYITLVNLLAAREPFVHDGRVHDPDAPGAEPVPYPEYLTCEDRSAPIAAHLVRWLTNPAAHAACVAQLERLKAAYGHPGASARAADYVLARLRERRPRVLRPHFLPGRATLHAGAGDARDAGPLREETCPC